MIERISIGQQTVNVVHLLRIKHVYIQIHCEHLAKFLLITQFASRSKCKERIEYGKIFLAFNFDTTCLNCCCDLSPNTRVANKSGREGF